MNCMYCGRIFVVGLLALGIQAGPTAARDEVELVSVIKVAGNQTDKSGLHVEVAPGIWHDLFGGISALEYLGHDDLYLALSDRGPQDGAVPWTCRVHLVRITPQPIGESDSATKQNFSVLKTLLLKDGERFFSGQAADFEQSETRTARLDPEGIRLGDNDNFFVSDEYGPHLLEFTMDGQLRRRLPIPERYQIGHPCVTKEEENQRNRSGRQGNKGLEGLARTQEPHRLLALFQSPLLQDCSISRYGKHSGTNCRLVEFDCKSDSVREFLYPLDDSDNKLNEILGMTDGSFLVIERDGESGSKARFKKILQISIAGATEIQDRRSLPANTLPNDVQPVKKQPFIDLLQRRFGLAGAEMPEKIEGLSAGPVLDDGRQTLLVATDNDFKLNQPTMFYCFAIGQPTLDAARKRPSSPDVRAEESGNTVGD